jgi:hypothetical protein
MALPLKAETFRPLADMADVFFVQCVGYGAFRGGGSRYHHRGCRWLYKGRAKATLREGTEQNTEEDRGTERGKILVHQPAAPRAFTTIVFVLNGEDWAETQTKKKNWGNWTEKEKNNRS